MKNVYVFAVFVLLLGGCARVPGVQVPDQVVPLMVEQELAEQELLNVSIRVFDAGKLPGDKKQSRGLSAGIREAEARFISIHLKYTMQRTGYWGMVRVVPDNDVGTDVLIRGQIVYSDGESLVLSVEALDSTNRLWFQHTYAETASGAEHEKGDAGRIDIFQDLFYTIANDLVLARQQLSDADIQEIRNVAEVRYASTMAPEAFSSYLVKNDSGQISLARMPPETDPMLARVRTVRSRDDMLLDTINGYYDAYYQDLWEPYTDWRRFRTEELVTMRDLERQALTRQVLGIASIVGAIAIGVSADSSTLARTGALRDVMIMGGAAAIYSGSQKSHETAINKEVIEELGASFASEADPLLVEVEGETMRLTGSAEQQYTRWRSILREIYARESGLMPEAGIDQHPAKQPDDISQTAAPVANKNNIYREEFNE